MHLGSQLRSGSSLPTVVLAAVLCSFFCPSLARASIAGLPSWTFFEYSGAPRTSLPIDRAIARSSMMQVPTLEHTLLVALSGTIISAALYHTCELAFVILQIAARLADCVIICGGAPDLKQRVVAATALIRKHSDFRAKAIFAEFATGIHVDRLSRGMQT